MSICLILAIANVLVALILVDITLSCFDFLSPYLLPLSNIRFRGRKSPYLGEENLWNSLHIFKIFGDMSVSK
jgi:hypothetical protein